MTDKIDRPKSLSVNAWTGESAPSQTLPEKTPWALQDNLTAIRGWLAAPVEADERDWAHPDVAGDWCFQTTMPYLLQTALAVPTRRSRFVGCW